MEDGQGGPRRRGHRSGGTCTFPPLEQEPLELNSAQVHGAHDRDTLRRFAATETLDPRIALTGPQGNPPSDEIRDQTYPPSEYPCKNISIEARPRPVTSGRRRKTVIGVVSMADLLLKSSACMPAARGSPTDDDTPSLPCINPLC